MTNRLRGVLACVGLLGLTACDEGPGHMPITSGGGGSGGGRNVLDIDGGIKIPDGAIPVETDAASTDGAEPDAPVSAMMDTANMPDTEVKMGVCDLVAQDCPQGQGCRPDGPGKTKCEAAEGLGHAQNCVESAQCGPGLVCGDDIVGQPLLCLQMCDLQNPQCPFQEPCVPFPDHPSHGYCEQ